jgi:hypothetical protein
MLHTNLLVAVLLLATPAADGPTPTAQYRVRFDATWSAATHPVQFPAAAHWSGLVGATHDATVSF